MPLLASVLVLHDLATRPGVWAGVVPNPAPVAPPGLAAAGQHAAGLVEMGGAGRRGVRADRLRRDDGDRPPQPLQPGR